MISFLSSSLEFLLADVGAIFVWTEGIYRSTADLAFNLTHQTVVPYLIHRGYEYEYNLICAINLNLNLNLNSCFAFS